MVPPESGGIIGSCNGSIISHALFDTGYPNNQSGTYSPNTHFLNQAIADWHERGIEFSGIFHTHASQWDGLSNNDRIYIIKILKAMPACVHKLYFPLVFPGEKMKVYCGRRNGGVIEIVDDDIDIIKKAGGNA